MSGDFTLFILGGLTMTDEIKKMEEIQDQTPPEVAGETPQDPDVVGSLTPEEISFLQGLRQKTNQVTLEIGHMELQKAHYLGLVAEMEQQGQQLLDTVAKRLGITDGQRWQVLPDGRAKLLRNVTPMPQR